MIPERIAPLNNRDAMTGNYVLLHAAIAARKIQPTAQYAVTRANELRQSLLVCFGLNYRLVLRFPWVAKRPQKVREAGTT